MEKIGEFVFLTNRGKIVDQLNARRVFCNGNRHKKTNKIHAKFPDGRWRYVLEEELFDPKDIPFVVGDYVKNLDSVELPWGASAWPGLPWEVTMVTYDASHKDYSRKDFSIAVLVCECRKYIRYKKVFFTNEVEKIEKPD